MTSLWWCGDCAEAAVTSISGFGDGGASSGSNCCPAVGDGGTVISEQFVIAWPGVSGCMRRCAAIGDGGTVIVCLLLSVIAWSGISGCMRRCAVEHVRLSPAMAGQGSGC